MPLPFPVDDQFLQQDLDELDLRTEKALEALGLGGAGTPATGRQTLRGAIQSGYGYSNLGAVIPVNAQRCDFPNTPAGTYVVHASMSAYYASVTAAPWSVMASVPGVGIQTIIPTASFAIALANSHNTAPPASGEVTLPTKGLLIVWPSIGALATDANDRFDVVLIPKDLGGPPGSTGPQGPQGPAGPSGSGGDKNYVHTEGSPSATWNVLHNLGKYPAVDVVDSGGSAVIPHVLYVDPNTVQLAFGSPTSGKAFVN